jgi:septum formation protein
MPKIILASQSPRRKMLLEWACIHFEVVVVETNEDYPASLPAHEVPEYIAGNKAIAVKEKLRSENALFHDSCIIAADTIVVLGDTILGKPVDRGHAIETLQMLSGKTHQVITGVHIGYQDKQYQFRETTEVSFHTLTLEQIHFYVDEFKPYDKAGAYGIQDWIGVVGIKEIKGDFYNVMGLPVSTLLQKIKQLGVI